MFYVTNRDHDLEEATRANLKRHGFPLREGVDTLLTRGEKEGWGSDKTSRRRAIAASYRVLMILGDDFNDFTAAAAGSPADRRSSVADRADWWGRKWFMLPNPSYGSWQRALLQPGDPDPAERRRAIRAGLAPN